VDCDPIPPLHNCGNTITKDPEKASLFNKYFCSVFTQENTFNLDSRTPDSTHPPIIDSISITPKEVYAACGPDTITSFLLKSAEISFLYHSVVYLINHYRRVLFLSIGFQQILFQYTLSSTMTSIIVVISLTSIMIKVFERILHRHLVSALEDHHYLILPNLASEIKGQL